MDKRIRDIKVIINDIKIDDDIEETKDYYELTDTLYNFLKTKDELWVNKFCNAVKSLIMFDEKFDVKNFMLSSKNMNKEFIEYFFDNLKLKNIINISDNATDIEQEIDDNIDEDIEQEINEHISEDKFEWRDGQIEALTKIKKNKYKSGIVSMITGSGKSLIFLKSIDNHIKINPKKGALYIIMCPRIDILRSLFFKYIKDDDKYILNEDKIKYWKDNDIINLEQFNIIDCIVNKPTEEYIKFKKDKYNLLIINNDYFRSIYKYKSVKKYICNNTQYITVDECHCISGNKIYEILTELKYKYNISIIGFSATPIRPTTISEKNSINIFSKTVDNDTNKKINLIYSYDLLKAIKDEIVLPYRIQCVKINKIKAHKIGTSNKDTLNKILQNCINNKTKNLPYKKFIIWTNRKDIMSECYKYIEKSFKELKVYCTSSFDEEFKKDGYNTNYEEYYNSKGNSVLICINKCKEGSDIPYVDCGIYFDGVKNRSILVHIQTSGRLIRPDKEGKKINGDLIDTFILDEKETPHTLTVHKIVQYLTKLLNLSEDKYEDQLDFYKQMTDLAKKMVYDDITETLKIKIDNNKKHDSLIENLKFVEMDWSTLRNDIIKDVDKKFGVTEENKYIIEFNELKKKVKDLNITSKKQYNNLCKKYNLIINPNIIYQKYNIWKGWYKFLDIDINIYPIDKNAWINKCKEFCITNAKQYEELYKKYNLPELPKELYNILDIDIILAETPMTIKRR